MAKTAVAVKEETAVAVAEDSGFEQFAGLGTTNITAEDQTIPRMGILEKMSPETDKSEGAYIPGAEPGMILDKLTGELTSGEDGVTFIPCHYEVVWCEWKPKSAGGGFIGQYPADHPIKDTTTRSATGTDVLPNGNELIKTANFFGILVHPTDGPQYRLIGMTKTKLKKARKWNTIIMSSTERGKNGFYTLPIMSQKYRLRTTTEKNDKGSFNNWEISKIGKLDLSNPEEKELFSMAVAFAKAVGAGEVKAAQDDENAIPRGPVHDDVPF
jgi:hypothetical protein